MIYGYDRIKEDTEQIKEFKIEMLKKHGAEKLFIDEKEFASGIRLDRPKLQELISILKEGDVVLVSSPERLARGFYCYYKLLKIFAKKKVTLMTFTSAIDVKKTLDLVNSINEK